MPQKLGSEGSRRPRESPQPSEFSDTIPVREKRLRDSLYPNFSTADVPSLSIVYIILRLSISLRAVVRLAEHLAVVDGCRATLRPGRDMVGIHFRKLPDSRRVRRVADCTERTV